jgi:GrpB-like predicted nucleotidyltransferase (UPF0157 family)
LSISIFCAILFCGERHGKKFYDSGGIVLTKPLDEMNTQELGQLFPIILTEYNPEWPLLFLSEKGLIEQTVGIYNIVRIQHIGSTSVPGVCAKPTIDILLELNDDIGTDELIQKFMSIGYQCSPQPDKPTPHLMFMKGYTAHGFEGQAYHVHVRFTGDWDELYFRDYLIRHMDTASEYMELKQNLKNQFEHDREAYTQGKTDFVKAVTNRARKEFGERY